MLFLYYHCAFIFAPQSLNGIAVYQEKKSCSVEAELAAGRAGGKSKSGSADRYVSNSSEGLRKRCRLRYVFKRNFKSGRRTNENNGNFSIS